MPVTPITPNEAKDLKNHSIPDEVIQAFNDLIVENLDTYGSASVKQKAVIDRITKTTNISSTELFSNNWLDVEEVFRKAGWTVKYDRPAYNESYDAYFEFSHKKK